MVCFESPDPHIRILWGTQFVTPVLCKTHPGGQKCPLLRKGHSNWPPHRYGGGAARVYHPRRLGGTTSGGDRFPGGTPRPQTSPPTPRHPKDREGIRIPGVPEPPLTGSPADGPPILFSGDRVSYDARKSRRHGDDPAGGTVS